MMWLSVFHGMRQNGLRSKKRGKCKTRNRLGVINGTDNDLSNVTVYVLIVRLCVNFLYGHRSVRAKEYRYIDLLLLKKNEIINKTKRHNNFQNLSKLGIPLNTVE